MDATRAGALRERIQVLRLQKNEASYRWEPAERVWANVELTGKRNLFSAVGIGARDATITVRTLPASLRQMLRWRELWLFPTEITSPRRGWLEIKAAVVEPVECVAGIETGEPGPRFPAVRTEKYMGYTQREPQTENVCRYVLVTPKEIDLAEGSLVRVADEVLVVQVGHRLDPNKNEYEVGRRFEP